MEMMPSYVYSDDDTHKVQAPKPVPEGMEKCDGCNGSGTYYGRGAVVNGKWVGFSGVCYRCQGRGIRHLKTGSAIATTTTTSGGTHCEYHTGRG